MITNINRLLTLRKNPELGKFFYNTDKQFPMYNLGANTPIINHNLQTEENFSGRPATLIIDSQASASLEFIRKLAQSKSEFRLKHKKVDTPIEFFCFGYQDHDGDIVIKNISIPAYNEVREGAKSLSEVFNKMYNYTPSKDSKIDSFSNYFDFLKDTKFKEGSIGRVPVAFYGTTRPLISFSDGTGNCLRFSDLAKSIVPGDYNFGEIMTGVLSVSPYIINQTKDGLHYQNGSLEAIVTRYNINQKNGYLSPSNITNIAECKCVTKNHKLENCDISKSTMPYMEFKVSNENYRY